MNASNYQTSEQAVQFGTWVSMCSVFATNPDEGGWRLGSFGWCPSQYNPALDYALDYSPEYAASVTAQLRGLMGNAPAALPFVVDTSRNGHGPLDAAGYAAAPYGQPDAVIGALNAGNWCNPPGAGLGLRPTSCPRRSKEPCLKRAGEPATSKVVAGQAIFRAKSSSLLA